MDIEKIIKSFEEKLEEFAKSEKHDNSCHSRMEGQWCCIDKEQWNYKKVIDILRSALKENQ